MTESTDLFAPREYDPVIYRRTFAATPGNAMKNFVELRLLDPLTFGAQSLQFSHRAMLSTLLSGRNSDAPLRRKVAMKRETDEFAEAFYAMKPLYPRLQYDELPGLKLGSTLERLEELVQASVKLHGRYEVANLTAKVKPSLYRPLLEAAESELESLTRRQRLLSVHQLALQNHFEHFICFSHPTLAIEPLREAEELYGPLAVLRDEYFISPTPAVLQRYIEVTAKIERSVEFARLREANQSSKANYRNKVAVAALDAADARLPELTAALEVFALME